MDQFGCYYTVLYSIGGIVGYILEMYWLYIHSIIEMIE